MMKVKYRCRRSTSWSIVVWICLPAIACGQQGDGHDEGLHLSYRDFDQSPGKGWRKLAENGRFSEAAVLIDRYEKNNSSLAELQRIGLRFHAGQMYAFAGDKKRALARFKQALRSKPPEDPPVRWNAYVKATIAFLERDRKQLSKQRAIIANGKNTGGVIPNLDVVDRLLTNFDRPYFNAYSGMAEQPK